MKQKVLVVEDEKQLQRAIIAKLKSSNIDVFATDNVDDALRILDDHDDIKAVWLDHYLLGRESGIDFVVKCKAGEAKHCNIPIYVISNTASADKVRSYIELGIEKYFVKSDSRLDEIIKDIQTKIIPAS